MHAVQPATQPQGPPAGRGPRRRGKHAAGSSRTEPRPGTGSAPPAALTGDRVASQPRSSNLRTVRMDAGAPPSALPCPEPEPEPEPSAPQGAAGASAPAAAADPLLGAMVEMAKAFAQPPPFSAFGGAPPAAQAAGNPWDAGVGGTAAAATPQPQQMSVPFPPVAASAADGAAGDDVARGLPDALAEQFGAAVSDLLDEHDGAGESAAGGPVPWAVLPATTERTGREASSH